MKQDWTPEQLSLVVCARDAPNEQVCEAFILDVDGDGRAEIALSVPYRVYVFGQSVDGRWANIGYLDPMQCRNFLPGLRAGHAKFIAPLPGALDIEGRRVQLIRPCE